MSGVPVGVDAGLAVDVSVGGWVVAVGVGVVVGPEVGAGVELSIATNLEELRPPNTNRVRTIMTSSRIEG
jgi:hypothetical protein